MSAYIGVRERSSSSGASAWKTVLKAASVSKSLRILEEYSGYIEDITRLFPCARRFCRRRLTDLVHFHVSEGGFKNALVEIILHTSSSFHNTNINFFQVLPEVNVNTFRNYNLPFSTDIYPGRLKRKNNILFKFQIEIFDNPSEHVLE